jgi:hypothetical protein
MDSCATSWRWLGSLCKRIRHSVHLIKYLEAFTHNLPQLQRAPIMFGWFIKSYKINVKVLKIKQVGVFLLRQVLSLLYHPAGARQQEGGAVRGRREGGATRENATTSRHYEKMRGQQSDRTMRGRGGGTTWGWEGGATRVDATTSRSKTMRERRSKRTTRRCYDERRRNNQPVRWDNKKAAQW